MCRILVFAIDQIVPAGHKGDDLWKRGDVVEVFDDGRSFGKFIEGHPAFRIIEFPGVPAAKYQNLTSTETETIPDPVGGGETVIPVRKRLYQIDIDGLEAKEQKPAGETLTSIAEADLQPVEKTPLAEVSIK